MNNPITNIILLIAEAVLLANAGWEIDEQLGVVFKESRQKVPKKEYDRKLSYWENIIKSALRIGGTDVTP